MGNFMQSIQGNVEPLYVDEKAAARIVAMSVSKWQKLRTIGDGPIFSKIGRLGWDSNPRRNFSLTGFQD